MAVSCIGPTAPWSLLFKSRYRLQQLERDEPELVLQHILADTDRDPDQP